MEDNNVSFTTKPYSGLQIQPFGTTPLALSNRLVLIFRISRKRFPIVFVKPIFGGAKPKVAGFVLQATIDIAISGVTDGFNEFGMINSYLFFRGVFLNGSVAGSAEK